MCMHRFWTLALKVCQECKYVNIPLLSRTYVQNHVGNISGKSWSQPRNHGKFIQQQGDRLGDDAGAESGDQQEAAGRPRGHVVEEHHSEGQHQHAGTRDQQDFHQ